MASPRWRKLGRDLRAEAGRVLLMLAAVAVSQVAVGAVLGAYAILTREIAVNYLGTKPASAALDVEGGVDHALVEQVRQLPAVADAEARSVVLARVRVGQDWRPMLLFVVDDFSDLRLNTFRPEAGAWPPPEGTMLIERTAVRMLEAGVGQSVLVKPPTGAAKQVPIVGLVHDPGLAPAWQEREGYGYITRATLAALGEPAELSELRISVKEGARDVRAIEATSAEVARWLAERGHRVHEIRVPPPAQHPHQRQMTTILFLMLAFAVLALVLSAIVVATSLAAMLARQAREIGVMKTVGARAGQLAGMYTALVASLGAAAALLALPGAIGGARAFSGAVSHLLNFNLTSVALPGWVFAVQAVAGVLVPLLVAAGPIGRASRATVRQALDQHGAGAGALRARFAALPTSLRSALRRPGRLALTVGLLAAGGAMFTTALDVSRAWDRNLEKFYEARHYDVEFRFHAPQPESVAERLRALPGVKQVEAWGYSPAALARPGQVDVARTYPDRGHASFSVFAPPPETKLVTFPVLEGRWLAPGDTDAVVLNHSARAMARMAGGGQVGSRITLSLDGQQSTWRVVGVVEEIGAAGVAYVSDAAFARTTGAPGARMLRLSTTATSAAERTQIIRSAEAALEQAGAPVEQGIPLSELRTGVGDHIVILIRTLLAMAVIMAVVGALGLGSALGISVLERTREFGVMKAIGATPGRVARLVVEEALAIAALSWVLAMALGAPLTALLDWLIGTLGFVAPLPFVLAPGPALLWAALVAPVALLASLLPARQAAALTVREALAQL